jgi:creatinine amidohydrolase/Fe(II)-dependent formamide hydrolase-like protein
MLLHLSTWREIEQYLTRSRTIVVPIGSNEQHGPTGPIREAKDFRARFPDGRMGSDPALATPEKGGELVRLAAQGLVKALDAFSREEMPG